MLSLIQTELLKLRRRKLVPLMMLAALIMPFFALLYFNYFGEKGIEPIQFYKWSAFSYTLWIVLPVILGILCAMLVYDENQNDILKQLWIIPISKMGYFFSKFFVVLIYSVCFMLVTATASILLSVLPGYVVFEWSSILYLVKKCVEIGAIMPFVMLPILALATSQKGYILPVSITLVYSFLGFTLMGINMYVHPLTSMAVIIMRNKDIPGIVFVQEVNILLAFLCIFVWDITAILLANSSLRRK